MALKVKTWADEITSVTDSEEFQTCKIKVTDNSNTKQVRNPETGEITVSGAVVVYEGRARFIPVRSSVFEGGEGQANAMSIRAARIQIPASYTGRRFNSACTVQFTEAPNNEALLTRIARVSEDFQGSTTATRTFHVYLDGDAEVSNG